MEIFYNTGLAATKTHFWQYILIPALNSFYETETKIWASWVQLVILEFMNFCTSYNSFYKLSIFRNYHSVAVKMLCIAIIKIAHHSIYLQLLWKTHKLASNGNLSIGISQRTTCWSPSDYTHSKKFSTHFWPILADLL